MDPVDGSPLTSGAHGTHRPCPLTCVETWRSRGSGRGTLRTIRSAMRPPGAAGRWESGPWEAGPWEVGPLGGGQGPDTQRRPCAALLLPLPRQAPRRRDCARRREPGSPIGSSCPLQIKGLSCGWAGGTMPPRVCTAVGRLRTVDPAPSRGQRAPGGNRGADRTRRAEDRLPARGRRAPAHAAARRVERWAGVATAARRAARRIRRDRLGCARLRRLGRPATRDRHGPEPGNERCRRWQRICGVGGAGQVVQGG